MVEFLPWYTIFQNILSNSVTKWRKANSDTSEHENGWEENFKQINAFPSLGFSQILVLILPIPYLSAIGLHFAGHIEDEKWRVIWDIKDLFLSNKAEAITEFSWRLEEKD